MIFYPPLPSLTVNLAAIHWSDAFWESFGLVLANGELQPRGLEPVLSYTLRLTSLLRGTEEGNAP